MRDPEPLPPGAPGTKPPDYVLDAPNVHALATSLETYARERHYEILLDASIWCSFDRSFAPLTLESLKRTQLSNLQLFYANLLRMIEGHDNVVILPEVKVELANLIAPALAEIERKRLQYHGLTAARKDRAVELFNLLLRIEELLRKIRARLEDRSKLLPVTDTRVHALLEEMIVALADTLSLKKPEAGSRSITDERLAARAFHDLLVHHTHVAVCTRDEDVRRLISTAYKLFISSNVRDAAARTADRAFRLGNIVVLKYNPERTQYTRFFESQTQQEIGAFIFSKFLPDKAKQRLISLIRTNLIAISRCLETKAESAAPLPVQSKPTPPAVLDSLGMLSERILWYQEVARAVGVADTHEEIRVQQSLREIARALGHTALCEVIERTLQQLFQQRIQLALRELAERAEQLNSELGTLTRSQSYQRDLASAERLRSVAAELAQVTRERNFFARALTLEHFQVTHEDFRRTEELCERFAANGFDIRERPCLVPATEIADLTGHDYATVIRIASEQNLQAEGGLVRLDLDTLIRRFL